MIDPNADKANGPEPQSIESVWKLGLDSPIPTFFMAGMAIWGLVGLYYRYIETGFSWGLFLVSLCGIVGFSAFLCAKKCLGRSSFVSAFCLLFFVLAGIFGSPDDFSVMFYAFKYINDGNNFINLPREKWEIVGLLSTLYMAVLYVGVIKPAARGFRIEEGLRSVDGVLILLGLSIILLFSAMVSLHYTGWHFNFIIGVTACFAAIDWLVWTGLSANQDKELKDYSDDARLLLIILDIPILLSLIVMRAYFWKLGCSEIADGSLGSECAEVYPFLAGAVAFQMISFNVIYVFFQARFHVDNGLQHVAKQVVGKVNS